MTFNSQHRKMTIRRFYDALRRPRPTPVVTKGQLTEMVAWVVSAETIIVEYTINGMDYTRLHQVLSDVGAGDLLPPKDTNSLHVVDAWQNMLPGIENVKQEHLFRLVYPAHSLVNESHWADVDAMKLRMLMDFYLRLPRGVPGLWRCRLHARVPVTAHYGVSNGATCSVERISPRILKELQNTPEKQTTGRPSTTSALASPSSVPPETGRIEIDS